MARPLSILEQVDEDERQKRLSHERDVERRYEEIYPKYVNYAPSSIIRWKAISDVVGDNFGERRKDVIERLLKAKAFWASFNTKISSDDAETIMHHLFLCEGVGRDFIVITKEKLKKELERAQSAFNFNIHSLPVGSAIQSVIGNSKFLSSNKVKGIIKGVHSELFNYQMPPPGAINGPTVINKSDSPAKHFMRRMGYVLNSLHRSMTEDELKDSLLELLRIFHGEYWNSSIHKKDDAIVKRDIGRQLKYAAAKTKAR